MPRVPVNGVSLNVEVVGNGPAVVAIHGFTGDMSTWDSFREAARGKFSVITVDVLGHGASEAPEDPDRYSMEHCAQDLLNVLDSLGLQQASWVGYSMGGRICLNLALAAPGRCRALVLESTSPGISDVDERRRRVERDEALARMIEEKGIEAFVDYWESQPLFDSQRRLDEEARQQLRCQRLQNSPTGLANSLRGMGTGVQPALQCRLPTLPMPVLVVVGEEDDVYCDIARSMKAAVPLGELAVIAEAGHAVHLEQPDRFNRAVLGFLRAHKEDR